MLLNLLYDMFEKYTIIVSFSNKVTTQTSCYFLKQLLFGKCLFEASSLYQILPAFVILNCIHTKGNTFLYLVVSMLVLVKTK